MNMTILSPSWKRAKIACTHKAVSDLRYVVCEDQAAEYEKANLPILVCPNSAQGSAPKARNWILENSPTKRLIITDDDVSYFGKWDGNKHKRMKPDEVVEFAEATFNLTLEWGIKMWGMNLLPDKGLSHEFRPFSLRNSVLGPFVGFNLPIQPRYNEKLILKDDYDMSLQMLNTYRRVLRVNYVHYSCAQHSILGGITEKRSVEREMAENKALQRRWGTGVVSIEHGTRKKAGQKREAHYDINPLVRVPIGGV